MKIFTIFLKTISAIFMYSILYSLLSAFRVDFIDLKICKFEFTEFLSISFLMIIYLTFSFYILLHCCPIKTKYYLLSIHFIGILNF